MSAWFGLSTGEEGSPLDEVFLMVLLCICLWRLMLARDFRFATVVRENVWLSLLIAFSFLSIVWSDIPFVTFKRWIREALIPIVMACVLLTMRDPKEAIRSILRRTVFVLMPVSMLLIKYFPDLGVQYRKMGGQMWIGAALQKNSLGRLCIITALFLVWTLIRRMKGRDPSANRLQTPADVTILGLALYVLSGPDDQYSATAVASLGASWVYLLAAQWMKGSVLKLGKILLPILIAMIIVIGVSQPFMGGSTVTDVSSSLGRDSTLTGRTEIWESLIPDVKRSPILGSGFASFWTEAADAAHSIGEAHNGYLEVLLDRGAIGMLLVALFLLSSSVRAQRLMIRDYDWGVLWVCFLIMTLVHNITESSINSFSSPLTVILLFFVITSRPVQTHGAVDSTISETRGVARSPR